jgi:DUF2075 family protein
MTGFEIERFRFDPSAVKEWSAADRRLSNWPVVYALDGNDAIYVGETLNAASRLRQHLKSSDARKQQLQSARVILDDTFNKSVCLDLESFLIRMFAGDGRFAVLNRNEGITDADYFDRPKYQQTFEEVFEQLRAEGLFSRSIPNIVNDDLFKLSPFKALNDDQAAAVEDILGGLFSDLERGVGSTSVIEGSPGTGKTIVAIFLMKLLRDIATTPGNEILEGDSFFSDFFAPGYRELLDGFRIALVVPQQSLRASIRRVFKKTPGLDPSMAITPFDVGESDDKFDLLIVEEAHRLNQRANQPSGVQNKRFRDINERLFGTDDVRHTQLDWIRAQSKHQLLLFDSAQSVRPADLPIAAQRHVIDAARSEHRFYPLASQMRVRAGDDYIGYVRRVLSPEPPAPRRFEGYDLRFFERAGDMREQIRRRDEEVGLARLVAGYAWEWVSKNDRSRVDIEIDGESFRWNSADKDWINSPGALDEMGSIHTVQGYDLNYAGVVIGPDLRWDAASSRIVFDRAHYFDTKGKENNPKLGLVYSDDDLLTFVRNVYGVLMTRGIRGTYLFVCDPTLRERLRPYFTA